MRISADELKRAKTENSKMFIEKGRKYIMKNSRFVALDCGFSLFRIAVERRKAKRLL